MSDRNGKIQKQKKKTPIDIDDDCLELMNK